MNPNNHFPILRNTATHNLKSSCFMQPRYMSLTGAQSDCIGSVKQLLVPCTVSIAVTSSLDTPPPVYDPIFLPHTAANVPPEGIIPGTSCLRTTLQGPKLPLVYTHRAQHLHSLASPGCQHFIKPQLSHPQLSPPPSWALTAYPLVNDL